MRTVLTDRQKEVLDVIVKFMVEHEMAPTLREIGDAIDIRSTNGVDDHLRALIRKGWVSRLSRKSRGIILTTMTRKVYGLGLFMPEDSQILENLIAAVRRSLKKGFSEEFELELQEYDTPKEGALLVLAKVNEIVQGEETNL